MKSLIKLVVSVIIVCLVGCDFREPVSNTDTPVYLKPGVASTLHHRENDWVIKEKEILEGQTVFQCTEDIRVNKRGTDDTWRYTLSVLMEGLNGTKENILFVVGDLDWRTAYYTHSDNPDFALGPNFLEAQERWIWCRPKPLNPTEQTFYLVADTVQNFNSKIQFVSKKEDHPFYSPGGPKSGWVHWDIAGDQGVARSWAELSFIDVPRQNSMYHEPVIILNFSTIKANKMMVWEIKNKNYKAVGNDDDWWGIWQCRLQICPL